MNTPRVLPRTHAAIGGNLHTQARILGVLAALLRENPSPALYPWVDRELMRLRLLVDALSPE